MTGIIKTLRADKGFGFIRDVDGKEVFFHSSAIFGETINDLREGDGVDFDLGEATGKGPRAASVRRTTT
jgi:CspA family cold shock protein